MINTNQVANRRSLRFDTLAEAIADAEALAAADAEQPVDRLGNWTLGQAIGHVAFWAAAPFDGYPELPPAPWLVRLMLKLGKRRLLNKGMPAGITIKGVPGGTLGAEDMPAIEAASKLRSALERLDRQCPEVPNPLFGAMPHAEWKQLNLRHAELHFSFFRIR